MTALNEAHAVADVEQGLVLATVEIGAPPARVFEALFRAEDVLRWWASDDGYRATAWEADVRPGGKWRASLRMADGRTATVEGEFTEVSAPNRLAFTWRSNWDDFNETRVTYMLEPLDAGTRLTLRHEGFADRTAICRRHAQGWTHVLSLLETDLRPATPPAQYFLFRLLPPRPTFMLDMTAEERSLMQAHGLYWRGKLAEGKVIVFGPVADPAGGWGVGIMRATGKPEADELTASDPVILANQGFRYEMFFMPRAVHV
jgi:uncharacterized protein YndB with AHSA1/START domain